MSCPNAETMRAASEAGWSHALQHRFVNELLAGALPDAVMARYLIQDHRFLDSFLVLLGAAFASADTFAARLRFGRFIGMVSAEENIYFLRAFETLGVTETRRAAQHTAYTRVDGWLTLGTYYRDGLGFVSLPDPGPGKEQLLRGVGC